MGKEEERVLSIRALAEKGRPSEGKRLSQITLKIKKRGGRASLLGFGEKRDQTRVFFALYKRKMWGCSLLYSSLEFEKGKGVA